MKKLRILVVMLAVVAGLIGGPVFADHGTPGKVAATVTPGLVAVTVFGGDDVAYGTVSLSDGSLSTAGPGLQTCPGSPVVTVVNSGTLNADFNIQGGDSSQDLGSGDLTSLTGQTTTVDVVTSANHGLTSDDVGSFVTIEGADGTFNGTFTIFSVTPDTGFVYSDSSQSGQSSGAAGTWAVVGESGSLKSGWDLVTTQPLILALTGATDDYGHMYSSLGLAGAIGGCDFLGTASSPGQEGTVATFTDAGGSNTLVTTDSAHGITDTTTVIITGTLNYNGSYTPANFSSNTLEFEIPTTFVADEDGGAWAQGGYSHDGPLPVSGTASLADNVVPDGVTDLFLRVAMPSETTQGGNPQIMPIIIQVSTAN